MISMDGVDKCRDLMYWYIKSNTESKTHPIALDVYNLDVIVGLTMNM